MTKSGAVALLMALGVVLTLALGASPAQAQADCGVGIIDYEGSAVLAAQPTAVNPGDTITLTGTGYPPSSEVPLLLDGALIGVATTDADGSFTFDYVVPLGTTAGSGVFSTECGTFVLTTSISFNVVTVTSTTTTTVPVTNLPTTGSSTAAWAQLGAGLLVGGGLLLLLARSRSVAGAPAA